MNESSARKRPILVWVISIFYFVSAAWSLLSFYLVYSGAIPLPPEQSAYIDSLTAVDLLFTAVITTLSISAAITLFLLRKVAFYLFTVGFGINIATSLQHILTKDWIETVGPAGLVGAVIGWAIVLAVCIYTWNLKQNGVLR